MKILGLGVPELILLALTLVIVVTVVIVSQSKKTQQLPLQQLHMAETRDVRSADSEELVRELRELKELRAQEILTDEEFSAKKKELLSL